MTSRVLRARLRPTALAVSACACAFVSSAAVAQSAANPANPAVTAGANPTLRAVVVTASRTEQIVTDALPHTTVLSRDVIERSQLSDLPALLAREAGFQYTQTGGRGQQSTTFLRGAASLQLLVLIDGVPITKQDVTGAVSLEHIMLDQVERIEIVRGNVSAIHGSGAIGGVIQIFTREPQAGRPLGLVSAELGSRGSSRLLTSVSGRFGDTSLAVALGTNRTDGLSARNPAQVLNVNPDDDGYRNRNHSLTLAHEFAPGHKLTLRTQGTEGRFDFDAGGAFAAATDVHRGDTRLGTTALVLANAFSPQWKSRLTLSQGRERNQIDLQTAFPYQSTAITDSRSLQWHNELSRGAWVYTLGAETQQHAIDSRDSTGVVLDRERSARSLYAGALASLGAQSLQLNVRRDSVDGLSARTTAYAGWGWQFTPAWKLIASASSAFNVPPLGYLYDAFSGNAALRPETARSTELGLQYAQGGHVLRASWFDTRTSDLLLYDFGTSRFNNVSRAVNQGLEVSYSARVGATDWRASFTSQDPRDATTGARLVRRAATLAALSASHQMGAFTTGVDLRYTGARPDTAANPALPTYALVDLTARWQLAPEWALKARVENALDKRYQTAYSYNQPGRGLFVGLSWQPRF